MILLDADVLIIDLRYLRDARFDQNRKAIDEIVASKRGMGVTTTVLLEVAGIFSFNVAASRLPHLVDQIANQYSLTIIPDPVLGSKLHGVLSSRDCGSDSAANGARGRDSCAADCETRDVRRMFAHLECQTLSRQAADSVPDTRRMAPAKRP